MARCPEEGTEATPVFLPGESPWTEKPGGLQSMGSQRVGHDCVTKPSTASQPVARRNSYQHNGEQEATDCRVVLVFWGQCQRPLPFVPHACCTGNRGLVPLCF